MGLLGCCARAASDHVAAAPPSSVMNVRRFMAAPCIPDRVQFGFLIQTIKTGNRQYFRA
jgi:hypothetical protein